MKRTIIAFVAAFGLSLGIATGVVMMRAPKVVAPVPGTEAKPVDSTKVAIDSASVPIPDSAGKTDSTVAIAPSSPAAQQATDAAGGKAAAGHEPAPASKSREAPAADADGTPAKVAVAPANALPVTHPPARPISDSLINRRLAQVFAAMQPKDAARVLEQMNDADVRAILGALSSKQQAAILGNFPTQRAALILQTTLRTASSGGAL